MPGSGNIHKQAASKEKHKQEKVSCFPSEIYIILIWIYLKRFFKISLYGILSFH